MGSSDVTTWLKLT